MVFCVEMIWIWMSFIWVILKDKLLDVKGCVIFVMCMGLIMIVIMVSLLEVERFCL